MRRGCEVHGIVTMDGDPVENAMVDIVLDLDRKKTEGHDVHDRVYTGPDGSYRSSRPLPPGTYRISACSPNRDNPLQSIPRMQESEKRRKLAIGRVSRIDLQNPKLR
jgi:hypothetical protein